MRLPVSLFFGLILAPPLLAAPRVLELDAARSTLEVGFGATLQTVRGTLGPASGSIQFDDQTGNPAQGTVVVDLQQSATGVGRRDRKMHEKILETPRYPHAVFAVGRLDLPMPLREGANRLQLHGTVDFHGRRHPLSLPAVVALRGDQVTATATVTIPYIEWGLRDPSYFLLRVAKEVRVDVRAVGTLKPPPALSGAHPQ